MLKIKTKIRSNFKYKFKKEFIDSTPLKWLKKLKLKAETKQSTELENQPTNFFATP